MTFANRRTRAMAAVLLAGLAIALAGLLTGAIGFGLSLAACFLVWIGGALWVNRDARPRQPVRSAATSPLTSPETPPPPPTR